MLIAMPPTMFRTPITIAMIPNILAVEALLLASLPGGAIDKTLPALLIPITPMMMPMIGQQHNDTTIAPIPKLKALLAFARSSGDCPPGAPNEDAA